MHPRTCPNCGKVIPIDHGFSFDENFNLIHDACGEIAFSTVSARDYKVSTAAQDLQRRNTQSHSHWLKPSHQSHYNSTATSATQKELK